MELTNPQRAALKLAIQADATAGPLLAGGKVRQLAKWCNDRGTTLAWREFVAAGELDEASNWAIFAGMPQGSREAWMRIFALSRDFSRAKVRKWVVDVWGAGADADAILQAGTEKATNAQLALGGTSKTSSGITALVRDFAGVVEELDVERMI